MASHIDMVLYFFLFLPSISLCLSDANQENFLKCMSTHSSSDYKKSFKYIQTPNSQSYSSQLKYAEQNPRWLNSTSQLQPELIITPYKADEIRAAILCSKKQSLQIRVKSGGHDYEGLSYRCNSPFVIVDLINLRSISVDLEEETVWIESGATLGELYYTLAQRSGAHAFPGGLCPSVGVGGHFSGGGFGMLLRKYGLAADNVIDASFIDVDGNFLDRKLMGEDLFWAIRGGGGASFGIIVAWKVMLVRIPRTVTVFTVRRNLNEHGLRVLDKWQNVAHAMPEDLMIRVVIQRADGEHKTIVALFNSLFLGPVNELLPLMRERFPELGLREKDCTEMSWIESVLYFAGFERDDPLEVLLDRVVRYRSYFKAKSDFVEKAMPKSAYKGIKEQLVQEEMAYVIIDPFGGKMGRIHGSELPFPHRKGNMLSIQYLVKWGVEGETEKHVEWIRTLYEFMETYVSGSPRRAYLNYRDLDLGYNTSYSESLTWGTKYFEGNFERLARVKKRVDPENFFRYEQSIPLLS